MPSKDKQEKRVIIIEPGDILLIRLGDMELTPAEAHQFGAAMKLLEINSLVITGDFSLKKLTHAQLTKLKEKSDAQTRSGFTRNPIGRQPGDAVPVREPSGGSEHDATDRGRNAADDRGSRSDSRGFMVRDRRIHRPR